MAFDNLTNAGEEYLIENNADGETVILTLYNDSTDSLTESSTLSDITTEPSGASYSRQSSTVTTLQISSDFGFDNDSLYSFDTSDSSQTVDNGAYIINFTSDTVLSQGTANDNLVAGASLSQSRDLSQIDTLDVAAGDLELTVS